MTPTRLIKRAAPTGQSCANCRYSHSWQAPRLYPAHRPLILTECRRFPPAFMSGEDAGADYPQTLPDGWCGEWRGVE